METLSAHLFWDTNRQDFDPEKNAAWIIQRVLEYGLWQDLKTIINHYGKKRIADQIKNLRSLEPKAANFAQIYFSIDAQELRCSTPTL